MRGLSCANMTPRDLPLTSSFVGRIVQEGIFAGDVDFGASATEGTCRRAHRP